MSQCCGNCKWAYSPPNAALSTVPLVFCHFPLPYWIKRELLNPLTGGGAMADCVQADGGNSCPTYAPAPEERE